MIGRGKDDYERIRIARCECRLASDNQICPWDRDSCRKQSYLNKTHRTKGENIHERQRRGIGKTFIFPFPHIRSRNNDASTRYS